MSEIKETRSFSINDILSWRDKGELVLSPKYQRNKVWNSNAKSYLIDSIIRGYPIPQIFIRQKIDIPTRKTIREVIDGQQRITAIIEYYDNTYEILKSHNKEYGGLTFKELPDKEKEDILDYNINFELVKLKDDSKIYEMFARLNTNNIPVNKQELRNAQYWGEFKVFVFRKSSEFKNIFIDKGIFKDKDLSRMADVDFMNSLIIQLIEGITTDSASKTESFYKKYDSEFAEQENVEERLNRIFYVIEKIFYNPLFNSKIFFRKNYFWTLFSFINQSLFNSLGEDISRNPNFSDDNISNNIGLLVNKLSLFESALLEVEAERHSGDTFRNFVEFDKLHRTRTTSKEERKKRVKILADYLQ